MTAQLNQTRAINWPEALEAAQLGLSSAGLFQPVRVSLTPWELSTGAWKMVTVSASAVGALMNRVSEHESWLTSALAELEPDAFAQQLLASAPAAADRKARNVSLSRHDFLQDSHGNWKLVESNTIAAGMGPFSDKLQSLLSDHHDVDRFAPNQSATKQANVFVQAVKQFSKPKSPNVVIVVEADEDNIYDHQAMKCAFEAEGATVYFRTLDALKNTTLPDSEKLIIEDIGPIHGLYFRTGYNARDYGDTPKMQADNLAFRGEIETKAIAISPTIHHQLASNKWVQMKLSSMTASALMDTFHLTAQQAVLAQLALSTPQHPAHDEHDTWSKITSGNWVLKSQGEGGGNVICRHNADALRGPYDDAVLMKTIQAKHRSELITSVKGSEFATLEQAQSELGIFTAGEHQTYAGYLLRTKPSNAVESGVHRGFGMIDTVRLIEPGAKRI